MADVHDGAGRPADRTNPRAANRGDEVTSVVPDRLLIGDRWREVSGRGYFDVEDPATGKVIGSAADVGAEDAVRALDGEGGPEGLQEYLDVKYAMFVNPPVMLGG